MYLTPYEICDLLVNDILFFNPEDIVWNGTHHALTGLQINANKTDEIPRVIENMQEAGTQIVGFFTAMEDDARLIVARGSIAPALYPALGEGDLTGITLLNLMAHGGALRIMDVSDMGASAYAVYYDGRLAAGIPLFYEVVACLLEDMRAYMGITAPFKVTFSAGMFPEANPYLGVAGPVVPGALFEPLYEITVTGVPVSDSALAEDTTLPSGQPYVDVDAMNAAPASAPELQIDMSPEALEKLEQTSALYASSDAYATPVVERASSGDADSGSLDDIIADAQRAQFVALMNLQLTKNALSSAPVVYPQSILDRFQRLEAGDRSVDAFSLACEMISYLPSDETTTTVADNVSAQPQAYYAEQPAVSFENQAAAPYMVQQPVEQPVFQQPVEQPVVQQSLEQPVVQQPIEQSVVQQPVEQPVVQQPIEQPVIQQAQNADERDISSTSALADNASAMVEKLRNAASNRTSNTAAAGVAAGVAAAGAAAVGAVGATTAVSQPDATSVLTGGSDAHTDEQFSQFTESVQPVQATQSAQAVQLEQIAQPVQAAQPAQAAQSAQATQPAQAAQANQNILEQPVPTESDTATTSEVSSGNSGIFTLSYTTDARVQNQVFSMGVPDEWVACSTDGTPLNDSSAASFVLLPKGEDGAPVFGTSCIASVAPSADTLSHLGLGQPVETDFTETGRWAARYHAAYAGEEEEAGSKAIWDIILGAYNTQCFVVQESLMMTSENAYSVSFRVYPLSTTSYDHLRIHFNLGSQLPDISVLWDSVYATLATFALNEPRYTQGEYTFFALLNAEATAGGLQGENGSNPALPVSAEQFSAAVANYCLPYTQCRGWMFSDAITKSVNATGETDSSRLMLDGLYNVAAFNQSAAATLLNFINALDFMEGFGLSEADRSTMVGALKEFEQHAFADESMFNDESIVKLARENGIFEMSEERKEAQVRLNEKRV